MTTSRRDFILNGLKLGAVGAAASAAPTLWLKRAHAASAAGSAKHVLVLFARGGLRSHCVFNAMGAEQHNPFGVQEAAAGTEWTLGAGCGREDIVIGEETIPGFHQITGDVAVLPCVDHNPGGAPDVDHRTATNRIATGDPNGLVGVLARVGHDHPMYADGGFSDIAFPPVELVPSEFGLGEDRYRATRPLSLSGPDGIFAADKPIGRGWKLAARNALDERFRETHPAAYDPRVDQFLLNKGNAALFASKLTDPSLNVLGAPEAEGGGFTNQRLLEILGNGVLSDIGDTSSARRWGADVAMALRFFAFGSPMVTVTRSFYDMHDNEATGFEPRTKDLVRQLAGLNYILKRMPHPSGGMFWDHTVVTVVSEFSRNNTIANTGFNGGRGSDHVTRDPGPSRNQAVPLMGGPVSACGQAGKLIGSTDREMNATGKVFSSLSLLSTLLTYQGINTENYWQDAPIAEVLS